MATAGPNSPSSSSGSWTELANVYASDNAYATRVVTSGTATPVTNTDGYGFAIPTGSTIDGIVVEVERKASSTSRSPRDFTVQLKKDGSGLGVGTDKASATTWTTSDAYASYGGAADLWDTTWTPAEINDALFGLLFAGQVDAGKGIVTFSIDHIRITVYYTPPAPVAAFTGTPLTGTAPLSVAFDSSATTNSPTSHLWEKKLGAGAWENFAGTPTVANPTESFTAGTWSVRYTATNAGGSDSEEKTDYVVASAAGGAGVSGATITDSIHHSYFPKIIRTMK